MNNTLERLRAQREEQDRGFTLIELLVVVVIIGILVGIAIPLYLNYRKGAENKSAESDLRGAISAAEQAYTDAGNAYPASANGANSGAAPVTSIALGSQTATLSSGNSVGYVKTANGYQLCAQNADGKHVYTYDSTVGGSVTDAGVKTLNVATCAIS